MLNSPKQSLKPDITKSCDLRKDMPDVPGATGIFSFGYGSEVDTDGPVTDGWENFTKLDGSVKTVTIPSVIKRLKIWIVGDGESGTCSTIREEFPDFCDGVTCPNDSPCCSDLGVCCSGIPGDRLCSGPITKAECDALGGNHFPGVQSCDPSFCNGNEHTCIFDPNNCITDDPTCLLCAPCSQSPTTPCLPGSCDDIEGTDDACDRSGCDQNCPANCCVLGECVYDPSCPPGNECDEDNPCSDGLVACCNPDGTCERKESCGPDEQGVNECEDCGDLTLRTRCDGTVCIDTYQFGIPCPEEGCDDGGGGICGNCDGFGGCNVCNITPSGCPCGDCVACLGGLLAPTLEEQGVDLITYLQNQSKLNGTYNQFNWNWLEARIYGGIDFDVSQSEFEQKFETSPLGLEPPGDNCVAEGTCCDPCSFNGRREQIGGQGVTCEAKTPGAVLLEYDLENLCVNDEVELVIEATENFIQVSVNIGWDREGEDKQTIFFDKVPRSFKLTPTLGTYDCENCEYPIFCRTPRTDSGELYFQRFEFFPALSEIPQFGGLGSSTSRLNSKRTYFKTPSTGPGLGLSGTSFTSADGTAQLPSSDRFITCEIKAITRDIQNNVYDYNEVSQKTTQVPDTLMGSPATSGTFLNKTWKDDPDIEASVIFGTGIDGNFLTDDPETWSSEYGTVGECQTDTPGFGFVGVAGRALPLS